MMNKIYKSNIKSLMPHPPKDYLSMDSTNFAQAKSEALISLEHNMNEINTGLQKKGNYK